VSWYGHRLGAVKGRGAPGYVPWLIEIIFRDLGQVGLLPQTNCARVHVFLRAWGGIGSLVLFGGGLTTELSCPSLCARFLIRT
jgi:hypothetical protein